MPSTVKRGNYYKRKSKDWYEKQGYTVELTEFVCGRMIGQGKFIYQKKDILSSDGIAYNEKEFILWNSKHWMDTGNDHQTMTSVTNIMKKSYEKLKVPPFIKKQLIIWQPKKKPIIYEVND